DVEELLTACAKHGRLITAEQLRHVVETNDKKRFAFSDNGKRIRASQGHSVEVELGYEPAVPPETLFHGTADRFLDSIRSHGLVRQARHHVHLSETEQTATAVGGRHGKAVVLRIKSGDMHRRGVPFFRSANGVWLVDAVPVDDIDFP